MIRYLLICLELASVVWAQAVGASATRTLNERPPLRFEADTPIITIMGICDDTAARTAPSNCKTVITLAEFTKIIDAVEPNMPPRRRKEFALRYAKMLVMADRAKNLGLDSGEKYEEELKLARLQIMEKEMSRQIERKAAQISNEDIEEYYKANVAQFEEADLSRLYLPKIRETPKGQVRVSGSAEGNGDLDAVIRVEAGDFLARALAGEDFKKLQEEASAMAGTKSGPLPNLRRIRRASLPRDQQSIMDLDPGQISPVIGDANGYVIYRIESKNLIPLDGVRDEIRAVLLSERIAAETEEMEKAASPMVNDRYFDQLRTSR